MASEWTADRVEKLKKLWGEGYSCAQIAEMMGLATRNSVIGKVHRLGLNLAPRPLLSNAQIRSAPRAARKAATPRPRKPSFAYSVLPDNIEPVKIELREADATPLHIDILHLTSSTCRWPYGDGPFTFCGCVPVIGRPYCEAHESLSMQRPSKRRESIRPASDFDKTRNFKRTFAGAWV